MDEAGTVYINPKSGNEMIVSEAMKKKLVYADQDDADSEEDESPAEMKHFVISAVVDRKSKRRVSFREATLSGLIDKDTGAYIDNVTGQRLYVADAISKGFLKAREIDDASEIDVEPENQMVVEKVQEIKNKLLKPLRVISMFKAKKAASQTIDEANENGK